MRKSVLLGIIFIGLVGTGIGGYFLIDTIINNYFSGDATIIAVIWSSNSTTKGDSVPISVILNLEGINKAIINTMEISISSEEYNLNDTAIFDYNKEIVRGSNYLKLEIGPLLNLSTGFFALNVGDYNINYMRFTFEKNVAKTDIDMNFTIEITNPPETELVKNGNFDENLDDWTSSMQDNRTVTDITTHPSLDNNSIRFTNTETVNPGNSVWVSVSQMVNLTRAHYLSFEQVIESTNCSIEANLFINGIKENMSVTMDSLSPLNQIIHFGEGIGLSNVTLQIIFVYADNSTQLYLDNISIHGYEHRVFVFMLNDNWEISGKEVARYDLFTTIHNTSYYFEKELGIKLIPVLELPWHPEDVSMGIIGDVGRQTAGELLGLEGSWNTGYGRSPNNHGFDLLTTFSNQTSDHFGFAYYKSNAAFHFAESEELGEYSYIGILADWAENLVQHEISHIFGALDRDRTFDPVSVMSKPVTPQQVWDDFSHGWLWLQVNNWMIEDILLMLGNRTMFD